MSISIDFASSYSQPVRLNCDFFLYIYNCRTEISCIPPPDPHKYLHKASASAQTSLSFHDQCNQCGQPHRYYSCIGWNFRSKICGPRPSLYDCWGTKGGLSEFCSRRTNSWNGWCLLCDKLRGSFQFLSLGCMWILISFEVGFFASAIAP